jgi:hypothetical protein
MLDCTEMTWEQMSEIIASIREEAERRNPIGINMYVPSLIHAEEMLLEIAGGEADNPTSDSGPTAAPDRDKPFGWEPAPQWAKDAKEGDQENGNGV